MDDLLAIILWASLWRLFYGRFTGDYFMGSLWRLFYGRFTGDYFMGSSKSNPF